jgi:RimJ/RimL family protein N-acetyltransferase
MIVLETSRLRLRRLTLEDAAFIFVLVNEPSWLRFIGDRGVRSLDDAREYIRRGPIASYERFGFGLYLVELRGSGTAIGMCGLLKRDILPDVDIGFAFLPPFWGNGYAREAASATLEHGRTVFGLERIVAVTQSDNEASIGVLRKIGMQFREMVCLSQSERELALYAIEMQSASLNEAES